MKEPVPSFLADLVFSEVLKRWEENIKNLEKGQIKLHSEGAR